MTDTPTLPGLTLSERQQVTRLLGDPLAWPPEFKQGLLRWLEVNQPNLIGLTQPAAPITSTNDLGAGRAGETRTAIAADGSMLDLRWDHTNKLWAGPETVANEVPGALTTSSTSYVTAGLGQFFPHLAWTTVGLTLQARTIAALTAGTSSTVHLALTALGLNNGSVEVLDSTNATAEINTTNTSETGRESGWVALNTSVTVRDFLSLCIAHKRTGVNNGTINFASTALYRWTYTP